jgi:hypothetical protein
LRLDQDCVGRNPLLDGDLAEVDGFATRKAVDGGRCVGTGEDQEGDEVSTVEFGGIDRDVGVVAAEANAHWAWPCLLVHVVEVIERFDVSSNGGREHREGGTELVLCWHLDRSVESRSAVRGQERFGAKCNAVIPQSNG